MAMGKIHHLGNIIKLRSLLDKRIRLNWLAHFRQLFFQLIQASNSSEQFGIILWLRKSQMIQHINLIYLSERDKIAPQ